MDRQIVYAGSIPLETDILNTNRFALTALGMLMQDVFGTSNLFSGLGCVPAIPASLAVTINAGSAYALQNLDNTPYSSLPADIAHQLVKQGVMLNSQTLAIAAPLTSGFSINYLVSANFVEADVNPVVLPYYNASNPTQAFSGPNGTGVAQNTTRQDTVQLTLTAGAAATSGTQATPATPIGTTALYVITVAFGQTTITAANISKVSGAPFLGNSLLAQIQGAPSGPIGSASNLKAANTILGQTLNFTADEIVVGTAIGGQAFRLGAFNQTVNTATTGAGGMDTGAPPNSGFLAIYALYNPTTGAQSILAKNATSGVQPTVYGGANLPAGYTASALIAVWPTSSTGKFNGGYQRNRKFIFPQINVLTTATPQASYTLLSVAVCVPPNAISANGNLQVSSSSSSSLGLNVATDASGSGLYGLGANGVSVAGGFVIDITTPQTIYYIALNSTGTPSFTISLSGYTI